MLRGIPSSDNMDAYSFAKGSPMKRLLMGISIVIAVAATPKADIGVENLSGLAYTDIGHLMSAESRGEPYETYYLNRFGVLISAEKVVDEKLRMRVGVGGLFWQTFPRDPKAFHTNYLRFGPGVNEASGEFSFHEGLSIKFGYFDYKYGDSRNLGEYLLRSESYPAFLRTGDNYTWVDSAFTRTLGARLRWDLAGGKFRQELGIFFEYQTPPLYDLTPTYIATWKPKPSFELGAGVAFRRFISSNVWNYNRDNTVSDYKPFSEYVTINNFPEVQTQQKVVYQVGGSVDSAIVSTRPGAPLDLTGFLAARPGAALVRQELVQEGSVAGTRSGIKGYLRNLEYCDETGTSCQKYLSKNDELLAVDGSGSPSGAVAAPANYTSVKAMTNRAINLMARASIDFQELFGLPENSGSFRLFSEATLLGAQSQPVYFEDPMDRLPVLVGLHVPTFGLLDLLSIEVEYSRNPYVNGNEYVAKEYLVIPDGIDISAKRFVKPDNHRDDWNWSVQAKRSLIAGLHLKLQVANDHMRMLNWQGEYRSFDALLNQPGHWYYVAHLEWGF
jgi:hypothetical protein